MALDHVLGEPKLFHPLVGFGNLANTIEKRLYADARLNGLGAWLLVVVPIVLVVLILPQSPLIDVLVLTLAIGRNSLARHANAIAVPLAQGRMDDARYHLSRIVSRDTAHLEAEGICKATVESVLENGNDSVFGAIFWYVIGGAAGVVLYRLANTLDAMWGYKNPRYRHFGFAAAKIDDALNYIPARLVAFAYAAMGNFSSAMKAWRQQAPLCESPNAGPVMAAGAGALQVSLGGAYQHGGEAIDKPILGGGDIAAPKHIHQALALVDRSLVCWLVVLAIIL